MKSWHSEVYKVVRFLICPCSPLLPWHPQTLSSPWVNWKQPWEGGLLIWAGRTLFQQVQLWCESQKPYYDSAVSHLMTSHWGISRWILNSNKWHCFASSNGRMCLYWTWNPNTACDRLPPFKDSLHRGLYCCILSVLQESPEGILSCLLSLLESSPAFVTPSPTLTSSAILMKSTDWNISRFLITKTTCSIEENNGFLPLSSLHPPPKPQRRCFLLGWRTKYFTSLLFICACPACSGSQKYEESVSHQS